MKSTKKKIDDLTFELTITVSKEDYAPAKKKKLNELKRTAEFKGFRKGMVPMSLIEKVYGDRVIADAVNELVSEEINNYITKNDLHVLGEPIASEKQPEIDWNNDEEFSFMFDVALSPEFSIELSQDDVVTSYNVTLTEAAKKEMKDNIRKADESKKDKTDEELENEVADYLKNLYKQEADYRLTRDIRDYVVEKANIALPEPFLKRWLLAVNNGKVTKEQVDNEFSDFLADFRWQLVRDKLMSQYELKVEEKDLTEASEAYVAYQYAMYGMGNVPDDIIKQQAQEVLHDENQFHRLVEQVENQKTFAAIKEKITVKAKRISADKFKELK